MTDARFSRPEPPFEGDERATLTGFLDFQRATFEWKCDGLNADQLAARATPPSTLSLLGIARHLADVERSWFRHFAGEQHAPLYFTEQELDLDFDGAVADQQVVDRAFADLRAEIDHAREIVAAAPLDQTFFRQRHGGEMISLRWILTHMIEEYARHNGHADLLREAIDGSTGE